MVNYIKYHLVETATLVLVVSFLLVVILFLRKKKNRYKVKFYFSYLLYKIGIKKRISNTHISRIHVRECYESLVDVVKHPKIFLNDDTLEHPVLLRKTVAMKLYKVADSLPDGVYLKIYSAFRSRIPVYNAWKQEEERLTRENPQMSRGELLKLVNSRVASPNANMGGHNTGAAVDVTLCDQNGNDLDLGTKIYDKNTNVVLTKEQQENRNMLIKHMRSHKFIGDSIRWWHYSYGDKSWSAYKGRRNGAIYGSIDKEFENMGYVSVIKTEIKSVNIK